MYFVCHFSFSIFTSNFEQVILCFVATVLVCCVPAVTSWNFVTNECCEIPVQHGSLLKVLGKCHFSIVICISEVSYLVELWSYFQQISCLFLSWDFALQHFCCARSKFNRGNTGIIFQWFYGQIVTLNRYHIVWILIVSFLVSEGSCPNFASVARRVWKNWLIGFWSPWCHQKNYGFQKVLWGMGVNWFARIHLVIWAKFEHDSLLLRTCFMPKIKAVKVRCAFL